MKINIAMLKSNPLLLSGLFVWLVFTAYLRPLFLPDEGRYGGVAREMLQGDWLVPVLNGMPFFHKPPLFYWIDILTMSVFGVNELTARAGAIVGAWLCGAAVLLAMRRWHGLHAGVTALLVLATSPLFYLAAQYANHDMLVAGLITVAILSFARAVEDEQQLARRWLRLGYAVCALAMLAKGLIGVVFPVLVIVPWLLLQGRWRTVLKLIDLVGILIFLGIAAPWFVAMQMRYSGFFDYFFVHQHFQRYLQTSFNNVLPFWSYFAALPLLTIPWALFAPAALWKVWQERTPLQLLYFWWLVAILLFFSLPSSKLVGYILPVLAPWSMLIGMWLAPRKFMPWLAGSAAIVCIALVVWAAKQEPDAHRIVASILVKQMAAQDELVFVGDYFYDIPFYAKRRKPVMVLEDWQSPEIDTVDNWRQELKQSAQFDPARGARQLIERNNIGALTCVQANLWFVVQKDQSVMHQEWFNLQRIFTQDDVVLYLSPLAQRQCRQGAPQNKP